MADETILVISGIGVSPYSARGLSQTLEPIQTGNEVLRTINGSLIDMSAPQFRKYKSTITGNDQEPPALDDVWAGLAVQVDCVSTLSYLTLGGTPGRPVVPGSSRVSGLFTIYRPRLQMVVMSFSQNEDEYGAAIGWTLNLEEA